MESDDDIYSLPLSCLPSSTRKLLSDLLNSKKLIHVDQPLKLPRDWRGLATLAKISWEVVNSFEHDSDKTSRVLSVWCRDDAPTIGLLLKHLQTLDRFDVYDDVCADLKEASRRGNFRSQSVPSVVPVESVEIITSEDRPDHKHYYDAFVLYADEDVNFVKEMKTRLPNFEFCVKENLLPGHISMHQPIVKLMTERCRYIITVYSPEFLADKDIEYYRDYAHAYSISNKSSRKLIPIMYRSCRLPAHVAHYFMLHPDSCMYRFWEKLAESLAVGTDNNPLTNGVSRAAPLPAPAPLPALPPLPSPPNSVPLSASSLDSEAALLSGSLANVLLSGPSKKHSTIVRYLIKPFKKKKNVKYKNEILQ